MITNNRIKPLIAIITIIIINRKHIGFDVAGIELVTRVKNIAYDSNIVIAIDTRSPDSTGSRNTTGFKRQNTIVGIKMTTA